MSSQRFLEVKLGDPGGDHLTMQILGRMYPEATDFGDGNWLRVHIHLVVGQFDVNVGTALRSEEFQSFEDQLKSVHATLSGEAMFSSMEDWLDLRIRATGSGKLDTTGELLDDAGDGNRLTFTIVGLDQSHLPEVIDDLTKIREAFPAYS